ncbi:hypothetical protein RI129_001282 [Pyrocoelia pectoralis]|uniref:Regulatory protein zeste n=1 Tax=Pyrocoelia pectoralis TaxID=417401 RepID=A0AAN7VV53_9COLE
MLCCVCNRVFNIFIFFITKMRVTSDHWQLLLSFATNHKEIITNKFIGMNGRENSVILWKNLTTQLNGLGFGEKTVDEWKKTLADWKSKTKAKAAKINRSLIQTGGGSPTHISLTNNEEKLLTLMGHTSYKGDIDLECGIQTKDDSEEIVNSSNEILRTEISRTPSKSTKRRQKLYSMGEQIKLMNDTTLSVLQTINTNIGNVAHDVKRIADALQIIAKK